MENTQDIFARLPEFSHIGSFSFIFWAIIVGLFLSIVVNMGPAFITLIQTSLSRGFRSAAWFAIGVVFNDAFVVSLCIMSSVQIVMRTSLEAALACIGTGLILIIFGIFTFKKKVGDRESGEKVSEKRYDEILNKLSGNPSWYVFFGKGFALNILNPFVWLFWFSSVAIVAGNMGGNKISTVVFFGIILCTTFAVELLKAWGAAKLKKFLTLRRATLINRIAGVMLMICGAYFIVFRGIANLV